MSKHNINCSVYGCHSRKGADKSVHFHYFTQIKSGIQVKMLNTLGQEEMIDIRKAREKVLLMGKPVTENMRVCSKHFTIDDYLGKGVLLLAAVTLLACTSEAQVLSSSMWAVLVAGSNGWYNYRHQADVCHAYHTLINKGVPAERIILMMYDDIAENPENPHKGKIFNKPNGTDVYAGVKIDYRGEDVSVDTLKKVLLGDKEGVKGRGTGRVLESGPNDKVFINFVDHGGAGVLSFPSESLFADEFIQILKQMKREEKYGEMVLFIEACESGSMFDNLLGHYDNIIASTAAAPDESSYAWYCKDGNCLGDLYSITWMNRLDNMNSSEYLFEEFDAIRTETLQKSHANLYGDYRLGFLQFGKFRTDNGLASKVQLMNKEESFSGVNSRDVPLHVARKAVENAKDHKTLMEKKAALDTMVAGRDFGKKLIGDILNYFTQKNTLMKNEIENNRYPLNHDMFDCYKATIRAFDENCYKTAKHTYFLEHMYKFANICTKGFNKESIIKAIKNVCNQINRHFDLII